jgi:protein-S-isoprenylcysteine O-methyltransferase Ste14
MAILIFRLILIVCFSVCLLNFAWGMCKVFILPKRTTTGMRLVAFWSATLALLHFWVFAQTPAFERSRVFSAAALYFLALCLFWWTLGASGRRHLPACFTHLQPSAVVTRGPYKWVRHPFYTSYLIAWVAGAEATLNPWLIAGFALMLSAYVIAARREERTLLNGLLSSEYQKYRSHTGMFFPRCWKATLDSSESGNTSTWM